MKRENGRQGVTYLINLCEWIPEQSARCMAKGDTLLRITLERNQWRAVIDHILKENGT